MFQNANAMVIARVGFNLMSATSRATIIPLEKIVNIAQKNTLGIPRMGEIAHVSTSGQILI